MIIIKSLNLTNPQNLSSSPPGHKNDFVFSDRVNDIFSVLQSAVLNSKEIGIFFSGMLLILEWQDLSENNNSIKDVL